MRDLLVGPGHPGWGIRPRILLDGAPSTFGRLSERALRRALHRSHPHHKRQEVTTVDKLVYLLPILACPIMMGAMMWMMMRGNHTNTAQPETATQEEIAALRAEVAALRSGRQPTPQTPATRA